MASSCKSLNKRQMKTQIQRVFLTRGRKRREAAASGLATLTVQELCSASSSCAPSSCWDGGLGINPQISNCMLTTLQESAVSSGSIRVLQLWLLTNSAAENESSLVLLALHNISWQFPQLPARPHCSLLKWGKCGPPFSVISLALSLFSLFSIVLSCHAVRVTIYLFLAESPSFTLTAGASSLNYIKWHCASRVKGQSPEGKAELHITLM